MTGHGYLTSVLNPNWTGLARVTFRSSLRKEPNTQYTVCFVDAGFGLKRLIDAIGIEGAFAQQSAEIPVDYEIDVFGLLSNITIDSED
jgi:hypothetical protein